MSKFELHAEAACCIWEALLDIRFKSDLPSFAPAIERCFEGRGTSEMRHAAIALSVLFSDTWHALDPDERDAISFDWDFVPALVRKLIWDADLPMCVEIPDVPTALALYRETLTAPAT